MSSIEALRTDSPGLLYGGDYNPEQWSEETWHEDARLMREAGVNRVTIGVFSWSSLEPREGEYTFGWLDRVLDLMHENGIGVVLATPTASPPPWFTFAHPEALPITKDGVRLVHGSRDTYNPAAPAYREAAVRIATALAERYADHPALAMWHVHNEYGTVSYGPVTDAAFQAWLRERYVDLDELNATWNTAFWSQGYGEWEHVLAPQTTQYLPNPSHVLDFKRFCADILRDCLRDQVAVLREATPDVPITTNLMLPTWNHVDQWSIARDVDIVSVDHYPSARDIEGQAHVAFGADLARSFGGNRPWVLMEQATSLVYDYDAKRFYAKEPGRLLRNTLQYIARGANGSLFFQWRAPRVGAEFFHSPMVPHVGPDSRVFREIVALGQTLARLGELAAEPDDGAPVTAHRVAIAYDSLSWWATETRALPTDDLVYLDAVRAVHRELWHAGINADVVELTGDLTGYDLVLVPSKLAASDAEADAVRAHVERGGHAAVWFLGGTTDEHLNVRLGGFSGAFADLAGVRVEEHHPMAADERVALSDGSTADAWAEDLQLRGEDVEAVASFEHAPLAGVPAITRRTHEGGGRVHYLATRLAPADLRRHLVRIAAEAGVRPEHEDAGDGLEVVRRLAGAERYLFAFNHGERHRTLHADGVELLGDREVAGTVTLAPGDSVVIRER